MSGAEALLGGRVRLDQDGAGIRASLEPVLLAAALPAKPGEVVLEAGTGIGTAALCLLARVPGVRAVGVERDPIQAARATANAALNGWAERFSVVAGDITEPATARRAAAAGPFAHAMANPPWFTGGTEPEQPQRRAARHMEKGGLEPWIAFLARRVSPGGSVLLVLPPGLLPSALEGFARFGIGSPSVLPLWPREGRPARRVILAGRKGGRGVCRILAGLVLHGASGFTAEAEAVLRHGAALRLG